MKKYLITLEVESESDPSKWYWGGSLVIDEEYEVVNVEEVGE